MKNGFGVRTGVHHLKTPGLDHWTSLFLRLYQLIFPILWYTDISGIVSLVPASYGEMAAITL